MNDELTELMQERQVAYMFVPQATRQIDGTWQAHYPAATWSVTGTTRGEALIHLRDAALERRGTADENTWQITAVRDHLTNGPVAGVYEIPLDVNDRIMNSHDPQAALDQIISQIDEQRAEES